MLRHSLALLIAATKINLPNFNNDIINYIIIRSVEWSKS